MITAEEKKQMKTVLKNGFPKQIQKNLTKKKILTRHKKPFSIGYITYVINGKRSNNNIEEEIIKLYQLKKEERRVMMQRRNEILGVQE